MKTRISGDFCRSLILRFRPYVMVILSVCIVVSAIACSDEATTDNTHGITPMPSKTVPASPADTGIMPESNGETVVLDSSPSLLPGTEAAPSGEVATLEETIPLKNEINQALESDKLVFVLFYKGCAPCRLRSQLKILDALETEYGDRIVFIRTDDAQATEAFAVVASPTLMLITGRENGEYIEYRRIEQTADQATLEVMLNQAISERDKSVEIQSTEENS